MKCAVCQMELVAGSVFCTNCGARVPAAGSSEGQQTISMQRERYDIPQASMPPMPMGQVVHTLPAVAPTSTLAILSLVFSILGVVALPLIGSLAGIVLGHMARREIRDSYGTKTGDGMAVAGLVIGYLAMGLILLAGCAFMLLFVAAVGTSM